MPAKRKCRKSSVLEIVDDDSSDCSLSSSSPLSAIVQRKAESRSSQTKPKPKPKIQKSPLPSRPRHNILGKNPIDSDNSEIDVETPQKILSSSSNMQSATPLPCTSKKEYSSDGDSNNDEDDDIDVVIPLSLLMSGSVGAGSGKDCTVLVQVNPEDAPMMEFHGASGAVGRFEANDEEVTMDLKGYRYHGILHPGPTTLVVSMHPKMGPKTAKVESITDEFVTISKGTDSIARLDAIVEKGDMDTSYSVVDEDVNVKGKVMSKTLKNDSEGGSDSVLSGPVTAKKRKGVTPKKKKKIKR